MQHSYYHLITFKLHVFNLIGAQGIVLIIQENDSSTVLMKEQCLKVKFGAGRKELGKEGRLPQERSRWRCDLLKRLLHIIYLYLLQDLKMQDFQKAGSRTNGRWTKEEHLKFLQGVRVYGKNWKKIEQLIETRTGSQIRSHAQKFFLKTNNPSNQLPFDFEAFEDDPEEAEEATLNSKTVSETSMRQEDFSFFLNKIIKHWVNKQSLDFWTSLVDSKAATANLNHAVNNNSFTNFHPKSIDPMSSSKKRTYLDH